MKFILKIIVLAISICLSTPTYAQEIFIEASGTVGGGDFSPLWLSANKNGLVSPYSNSAYERAGINGTLSIDSVKQMKMDYAFDIQLSQNAQSKFFIHEAYAELSWKKVHLVIGQKEHRLDFRNERLCSGGLGNGINALPIPEATIKVDYFSFPGTNRWLKVAGRLGYGKTTDGNWQESWIADGGRYTSNILYNERALFLKLGREDKFPLTLEGSLQMMTQFGGISYNAYGRNHHDGEAIVHSEKFSDFWHALWPMGSSDVTDGNISNAAGNTFGSYIFSLKYQANRDAAEEEQWYANAYFERMFEDQSMLTVQYGIYDHLVGLEFGLKKNPFVSHIIVEHISSKDQAGPVYHDKSPNMPESYTGMDNYYNHSLYTGWQHWGVGMGNPLFPSPIYNSNHHLEFLNNRLRALHFGIDGNPTEEVSWRVIASFTRNWGTYAKPYPDVLAQQYYLAEAAYQPKALDGWKGTLAFGWDHGSVTGNKTALQITIRKTFKL